MADYIINDIEEEQREIFEQKFNAEFVESCKKMESETRETLENMFEIVKKHEQINKKIKNALQVSIQALQPSYDDILVYTKKHTAEYKQKVDEINQYYESVFIDEKNRYFIRHNIRMQTFTKYLRECLEYLDNPQLLHIGRVKVLGLREIQKFRTNNALAQIEQWNLTYDAESFQQSRIVNSTLVSNDEYKNMMRANYEIH